MIALLALHRDKSLSRQDIASLISPQISAQVTLAEAVLYQELIQELPVVVSGFRLTGILAVAAGPSASPRRAGL